VIHANKKIAGLMQEKQTVYNQVQELTGRVKNRARGGRR
jgi:chromosomal replication initiator protein